MAKLERYINEDFDTLVGRIHNSITQGSISATFEGSTIWRKGSVKVAHLVFERYSYIGNNRVSMSVCLMQQEGSPVHVSAITSGGSQAMFFKINTLGEEAFLEKLVEIL